MRSSTLLTCLGAVLLLCFYTLPASAQYFGRNKVQYDVFDFQVLPTDHFDIYFYPEEEEAVRDAARMAERWYRRHSRTFLREFREKKPVIFYANDADFHQTNVIMGQLGEGTGGVTEGLKQRVVMPLTGSYADTDHVLGHELVHSFQYDIAFGRADSIRFNLGMIPLWLVEGMAEYLSVGRVDAHTAMWLRDAALRDDLPSIRQLTTGRYFPYRYGQAYMAYIGGKYGDAAVANLFKLAGRAGVDSAFVYTLGITTDSLSSEWQQVVKDTYLPLMEGRVPPEEAGRLVLARGVDAGDINIAPAVSPDGRYVAFLSERDVLHINLFVADAETGEVITRLKSVNADAHFDALRFINTAGSWSPDGKRLAFVTFTQGRNEIAIWDVDRRSIERRISVEGVGAMTNPAWSPDGQTLAFSGIDGGISDLYLLDLATNAVRQLTSDRHADLQPAWSPDGQTLAFVTDRGPDGSNFETLSYAPMRLGLIDVTSGEIQVLRPFGNTLHHNPQFSPDGRSLYFISDQDGFKDIYRLDLAAETPYRVTHLKTGVSGITGLSPAMSVAAQSGRMMFTVFAGDNEYSVFALEEAETQGEPVAPLGEGIASAGVLPPLRAVNEGLVGNYLNDPLTGLPAPGQAYDIRDYRARLRLDYVAPPTVGASFGGPFGTRVGGGVAFFFSDMLGDHNLSVVAQANGTFKDIGGQVGYLNQKRRLNYGGSAGHIPLLFGGSNFYYAQDPDAGLVQVVEQIRYRIFIDQVSGVAAYPFSTTRRAEVSAGFVRYGFNFEVERFVFDQFGGARRELIDLDDQEPDPFYFFQVAPAYVGDYSMMGFTSPIAGGRYRFQAAPLIGTNRYLAVTADYRRYFYMRPFTFAVRGLHYGNYGINEEDLGTSGAFFGREYMGYPYYPGFVRGYNVRSFEPEECAGRERCLDGFLTGTRLAVASAEVRIPLLGPEQIALVDFPYLPLEVSPFFDAGLAWNAGDNPFELLKFERDPQERVPVFSAGVSTRVNLLGYLVLEMYYAYPFQRPVKGWHLGFQLIPGW